MSLAKTQELLARLYTDAGLRRRFFADPESVGREARITGQEARELAAGSREQIESFARSLQKKRLRSVRHLLPRTADLLGQDFGELFFEHAGTWVPTGLRKIPDDALAFADFLARRGEASRWTLNVLRWETAWIRAHDPDFRFDLRRFDFRMGAWDGTAASEPPRRASIALWWRWGRRGRLRHFSL